MKKTFVIFKKEFISYFNSPIAYVYLVVFLLAVNWSFFKNLYLMNTASMNQFFSSLPWLFLFFVPAVSMRIWAEEKKSETIEVLLTLPVRDSQIVAGKFAAALSFIVLSLLLTLPMAFTVSRIGNLDWGPVIGGYLAACLAGGAFLGIGMVISCLTENQIVAFILSVAASFTMIIIGEPAITMGIPQRLPWLITLLRYLGLNQHFESISRGVLDVRDLVYYSSLILFSLHLNILALSRRQS
ncbi:MAG: ABC transporter permease [Candidatus Wallbacteria bacterium]|nr:ABC transporter permease [Candidatus Wallbacteria bacterium]